MTKGDTYGCPSCGAYITVALPGAMFIVCRTCRAIVTEDAYKPELPITIVPADWSFVQINTTGQYRDKSFTITGRIRLQLRNEYKNFWCAVYDGNKSLWIMESFGSFSVLQPHWKEYKQDIKKVKAGYTIQVEGQKKLTGEYVDKCEETSYEGQVGTWPLLWPKGFFVAQASNKDTTAFFKIHTQTKVVDYMLGEKATPESLKLGNILQWNEWL